MYVDVFVAGIGKWYEFKCEEAAMIENIIMEIYITIKSIESEHGKQREEGTPAYEGGECKAELYTKELNLVCIDSRQILDKNARLRDCRVENGNKLILI